MPEIGCRSSRSAIPLIPTAGIQVFQLLDPDPRAGRNFAIGSSFVLDRPFTPQAVMPALTRRATAAGRMLCPPPWIPRLTKEGHDDRNCPEASERVGGLMQADRRVDVSEPTPPGGSGLADLYRMELAFDVAAPELQKPTQLGKIGGDIEFLPDKALQQGGVVGKMVDYFRRRQPILREMRPGVAHIGSPLVRPPCRGRMPA